MSLGEQRLPQQPTGLRTLVHLSQDPGHALGQPLWRAAGASLDKHRGQLGRASSILSEAAHHYAQVPSIGPPLPPTPFVFSRAQIMTSTVTCL